MIPKVFFDEAGNAGSNITNREQPYFVLSAVSFTDAELQHIQDDVVYAGELHLKTKGKWRWSQSDKMAVKSFFNRRAVCDLSNSLQVICHICFYGRYADRAFYEVPSKREFV